MRDCLLVTSYYAHYYDSILCTGDWVFNRQNQASGWHQGLVFCVHKLHLWQTLKIHSISYVDNAAYQPNRSQIACLIDFAESDMEGKQAVHGLSRMQLARAARLLTLWSALVEASKQVDKCTLCGIKENF